MLKKFSEWNGEEVYKLKIKKEFFELILKGIKKTEVRKMNKSNIAGGNYILYVDIETNRVLGMVSVFAAYSIKVADVMNGKHPEFDGATTSFILSEYLEETDLMAFDITLQWQQMKNPQSENIPDCWKYPEDEEKKND